MRLVPFIFIFVFIYIEVSLFIAVASSLGVALSLLLIVLTSCIGVSLVKSMGLQTLGKLQQKLQAGENPAEEMIKSVSLLFAGFLLLLPGFFTDILGVLLLLPPLQKLLIMRLLPLIKVYNPVSMSGSVRFESSSSSHFEKNDNLQKNGNTIEGEFERKDDDK